MTLYIGNEAYAEFFASVGAELDTDMPVEKARNIIITEYSKRACEAAAYAKEHGIPLLGVMDGYKSVAEAFGAKVKPIDNCEEGRQEWAVIDATSPVYIRLESVIRVARGKAYAVDEPSKPAELDCMSRCETGEIIALRNMLSPKEYGSVYALNYDLRSPLTVNGVTIAENFINQY